MFKSLTVQLKANAITVKTVTLVDATIIASASEEDGEAHWIKHEGKPAGASAPPTAKSNHT